MKILLASCAGALALFGVCQAHAQPGQPAIQSGPWYGGAELGAIIPNDVSYSASDILSGTPTTISGNLTYSTGVTLGAFFGYHFSPYLAAEGDFTYSHMSFDKLTANATGAVTGSVTFSVNGHTDSESFFVNPIVTPLGESQLAPYVGGGIGIMNHDDSLSSIAYNGTTYPVNASGSGLDFAVDAIAGIDWTVTHEWSLGARYTFVWANLSSESVAGGSVGNFTGNIITATAIYHF